MSTKPSYEDLAEAIARCVHARLYQAEAGRTGWTMTVDNMCSSDYQILTGVLERLDILRPLDAIHRRSDFTCIPDAFAQKISQNKEKGCSYDTLVIALMCLLEKYPNQPDVHDYLVRLGVCRPRGDVEPAKSPWVPEQPIEWADGVRGYAQLRHQWVHLLQSSAHDDPCI